ncbi:MAG: FG-GAP-like repeat-containing protein [Fuerstiella sp.]
MALKRGQLSEARRIASQVPADDSRFAKAVLIAGEAATKAGDLAAAADIYRTLPLGNSTDAVLVRFSLGEVLLHSAQIAEAEQAYRSVMEVEPGYVEAYSRLAFILGVTGRRRESQEPLFAILRSGAASLNELILLADLGRPVNETEMLKEWSQQNPDDPFIRLGLACRAVVDGEANRAIRLLKPLIDDYPKLKKAQLTYGELLAVRRSDLLLTWYQDLPAESGTWPELSFIKGRWAQVAQQDEVAARCFLEVLQQLPLHRRAAYELGIVLHRLQHPAADEFANLASELLTLSGFLTDARETQGTDEAVMQNIIGILAKQKRSWEVCAWAALARQRIGDRDWIRKTLAKHSGKLSNDLALHPRQPELLQLVDADSFPPFDPTTLTIATNVAGTTQTDRNDTASTRIHFTEFDNAAIPFVYFNAHDESTKGARIQEQTGGGASVLDVDMDSFPDLYFVQGAHWPHEATESTPTPDLADQIFRNRRGSSFDNITAACGIDEFGFGQCAAVGDVNEDGFPDLYIANIGQNQLYLNQGDGTFHGPMQLTESAEPLFTSSAVIADMNGDGRADIFDANYVTGRDVYHRICGGRACSPSAFDGVLDLLHLADDEGFFEAIAGETPVNDAKGLGVVAFSIDDQRRPSIFVANDQTPNFLLQLEHDESNSRLIDYGLRSGLAYDQQGLVTAAMGIATEDVDHNGAIDVFISNFQDESNCLYLQTSQGFFTDTALAAGLRAPSYSYVGWGAQFIDADLNGEADLVLANGHVGSYFDEGRPPKMPTQCFRNTGEARFAELTAEQAGPFFAETFYGRSIAKLDWNRDGLVDFIMVPIRENVRLLTNDSATDGRFIHVRLTATNSSRDAFFTTVELQTDRQTYHRQLVAGGGYHAANENVLQFGFLNEQPEKLTIRWPSGNVTELFDPSADSQLHFIEDRNVAAITTRDGASSLTPVTTTRHENAAGSVSQ